MEIITSIEWTPFDLYAIMLILIILGNLAFSFFHREKYKEHLSQLRKLLYSFFAITILLGIILNELELSNWVFITTLTFIIIFLDLSLFLTPNVSKFFQAEFTYEEKTIELVNKTVEEIDGMVLRVETMSEMIQNVEPHFANHEFMDSKGVQHEGIQRYIAMYSKKFGFRVELFPINNTEYKEDARKEEVRKLIETFRTFYSTNPESEWESELLATRMVYANDNLLVFIPIYMSKREMIVVLIREKGNILTIDADHITNLVYMYYENISRYGIIAPIRRRGGAEIGND